MVSGEEKSIYAHGTYICCRGLSTTVGMPQIRMAKTILFGGRWTISKVHCEGAGLGFPSYARQLAFATQPCPTRFLPIDNARFPGGFVFTRLEKQQKLEYGEGPLVRSKITPNVGDAVH